MPAYLWALIGHDPSLPQGEAELWLKLVGYSCVLGSVLVGGLKQVVAFWYDTFKMLTLAGFSELPTLALSKGQGSMTRFPNQFVKQNHWRQCLARDKPDPKKERSITTLLLLYRTQSPRWHLFLIFFLSCSTTHNLVMEIPVVRVSLKWHGGNISCHMTRPTSSAHGYRPPGVMLVSCDWDLKRTLCLSSPQDSAWRTTWASAMEEGHQMFLYVLMPCVTERTLACHYYVTCTVHFLRYKPSQANYIHARIPPRLDIAKRPWCCVTGSRWQMFHTFSHL
jgi:hypothetical protein